MSDQYSGKPRSPDEWDAYLEEGLEERIKAACAQDPGVSRPKPEPQQSPESREYRPENSTSDADPKPEEPEASWVPPRGHTKPKKINPPYVKHAPDEESDQQEITEEEQRSLAFQRAIIKGSQLLDINIPPKAVIIEDWCREGNIGFIFAFRGTGKTWFVLHLCTSLSSGTPFGPWQINRCWPVLYVDGEMTFDDDKSRIMGLWKKIPEQLHVLNHEVLFHLEGLVINLARKEDQEIIRGACLELKIKALVLDNLSCLFTGVDENDAAQWEKILPWLLQLRRDGIATVIVHHTGVDPSRMRGTTKREDPVDWTLRLDNCKEDYSEAGTHFISKFKKYRDKIALDYEWRFEPSANGEVLVTFKEASRGDLILQWVANGLTSCDDIAKELGVSKGTVSKLAQKLIAEGKLTKSGRDYELPTV
jgi:hypothetical protein